MLRSWFQGTDRLAEQNLNIERRRYLASLYAEEEKRQAALELKLASVVGQSSLFLSILVVIVTQAYPVYKEYSIIEKIIFFLLSGLAFTLVLLSLRLSTKTLNIKSFRYMTGSPSTVSKKHSTPDAFIEEEIVDLQRSIRNNFQTNNEKGTLLIRAQRYFWASVVATVSLGVLLLIIPILKQLLGLFCM